MVDKNEIYLEEKISDVVSSFSFLCNSYGELMEDQRMPAATFVKLIGKVAALHVKELSRYLKLRDLYAKKDYKLSRKELLQLFARNHKELKKEPEESAQGPGEEQEQCEQSSELVVVSAEVQSND